jgi:Staphylococcal nuclease homologue
MNHLSNAPVALVLLLKCFSVDSFDEVFHGTTQLDLALQLEVTMEQQEECLFVRLLPDGSPVVNLRGTEQRVEIDGIQIPQPPPNLYIEMMTQRLPRLRKPLRCVVRAVRTSGQIQAKLLYYGWQDKSGDVWLDLGLTLVDEGLARVSEAPFPERNEYLQHERKARSRRKGIWAEAD